MQGKGKDATAPYRVGRFEPGEEERCVRGMLCEMRRSVRREDDRRVF